MLRRSYGSGLVVALALGAMVLTGCVRSRVFVTTDPPGARVMMNDIDLGHAPVEMPFTWYWYYDFRAEADGYEPAWRRERFDAPPWLWIGPDLVMELMPFPVYDTRRVHLELTPERLQPRPEYVTP